MLLVCILLQIGEDTAENKEPGSDRVGKNNETFPAGVASMLSPRASSIKNSKS